MSRRVLTSGRVARDVSTVGPCCGLCSAVSSEHVDVSTVVRHVGTPGVV